MTSLSDQAPAAVGPRPRSTIREVAALAGVGIKTVSRVINAEPNVAPSTVENVLRAVRALNYVPNLQAGNLRRSGQRTHALGLLVGNVANPFSGAIHRAVEDAASRRKMAVFASSLDDDASRERSIVSAFLRRRVDGLILTTISPSQEYLQREQEHGTSLVFIDRAPVGIDADTVVSDNLGGAAAATAHLVAGGHRRIAYLGDRNEIFTARQRRAGFLAEMRRAGLAVRDGDLVDGLADEASAHRAALALLQRTDPPTAIFSSQNLVTIGAIRALRECGLHRKTALVGFDDLPLADLLDPGITVIAQDARAIGSLAVERIFARLDGDVGPGETFVVPTRLIERGSGEVAHRG